MRVFDGNHTAQEARVVKYRELVKTLPLCTNDYILIDIADRQR